MLLIDISQIPPEGLDLREDLVPAEVHVESEGTFALQAGGSVQCHVDKVDGASVHVRGRLRAQIGLECSRCLEPYALPVDQDLDLFYLPHTAGQGDEEEQDVELKDRDMVVAYYQGDRLDLGEVLREQLFLATPLKPLCRGDCRGRCAVCGADRNRADCACPAPEAEADPRLLELKKLLDARSH